MSISRIAIPLIAAAIAAPAAQLQIPIEKYRLSNGMRVILSRDSAAPVVTVYVIYDVGARVEQKGRTGFAHLFEHMMFQGSKNAPKGMHFQLIEANGGWLNGSTHADYTDYFEVMPSSKLALALWLEADRMRGLNITKENLENQKEAVKEERRLRMDNQPYVTAIVDRWPALAFRNWSNAHSLMGSYEDLNAATVDDVAQFFKTYYAPNNAVLVIAGDFEPATAKKLIATYFGDIPPQPQPKPPDLTEPPVQAPRSETVTDRLAKVPALIAGFHGPVRRSHDYYALVLLDVLLTGGDSSRISQNLIKGKQSIVQVEANLGWPFGGPSDYKQPGVYALMALHKPSFKGAEIAAQIQEEIAKVQRDGVEPRELERVKTQLRSSRIHEMQSSYRRAALLGQYEIFDGDPSWINTELDRYQQITAKDIQAVAERYLRPEVRITMEIVPPSQESQK